jgi:hypothetical protein
MITPSIDFIGTGGGGVNGAASGFAVDGVNGGGAWTFSGRGGFPGGGGGINSGTLGGRGFVIVEY